MNIVFGQPASPAQPSQPFVQFCGTLPHRSRCAKTVENSLAFAVYLPTEFDAFSFSGPEQILGDTPLISSLLRNRFFRRRFDRCGRVDRSRCAKTSANVFGFALYLPHEFDASGFSGPEQNLVGAPRYSSLGSKIHFATPIRSMSMPRSIEVLKNDRNFIRVYSLFP